MARNHHFVPKCYLRGFIDPSPNPRFPADDQPRIWQAELKSQRIRLRPTHKVGCSPGFYALGSDVEDINEAAERAHGKLESAVAPTLNRLNNDDFKIEAEDWENLLVFGATLAMRGPSTRVTLNRMRKRGGELIVNLLANLPLESFMHQLKQSHPDRVFTIDEARGIQEWARNPSNFNITPPSAKAVETSLKTAMDTVFPLFYKMNWTYLHAPTSRPFICSDYPVSWVDPTVPRNSKIGHGLEAQHIEVSFPIGRSLALMGHWDDAPKHLPLTSELVDQLNLRSVERARIEILGPTRESVEWGLALWTPRT